jgi:uncharacterized iron-regulated protein
VETATGRWVSLADIATAAERADVVYIGEEHDDHESHFVELALLDAIGSLRPRVVLSLEMFERDVQSVLDRYLDGTLKESDFLAVARPWERYATDYRPMVLLARARGWRVVAANVPRTIASGVSREGLRSLEALPAPARAHVARELVCARDAYYRRFVAEMGGHAPAGSPGAMPPQTIERYFDAQCIKDETMAESIVAARFAPGAAGAVVVHVTGSFHSAYGLGTVDRVMRRAHAMKQLTVRLEPVADPATASPPSGPPIADYVIFTRK